MNFTSLVEFYKLSWSFIAIDTKKRGLIDAKMIDDGLVKLPFPVSLTRDEQFQLD